VTVFADTSGLACFLIDSEPHHDRAVELVRSVHASSGRLMTTNYILSELVALFGRPLRVPKPRQVEYVKLIRSSAWIDVVRGDDELEASAWKLWEDRPDKEWSFVDCVSFTVMHRRGLAEALTTDRHFNQAGFVRLLK